MRTAIFVLSVLLAVLLLTAGVLYFGQEKEIPVEPTGSGSTTEPVATTEPEPSQTEPTESTKPPEPALELIAQEPAVYLNGMQTQSYLIRDRLYIDAAQFAETVGLSLDSESPVKMTGRLDSVEFSSDGQRLTVNGETQSLEDAVIVSGGVSYILFMETVEALGYPIYLDEEMGVTYITPSARAFAIPEGVNVPVLMYHAVSDNMWGINELFVSPTDMEEQLAYLVDNGYDPIWFEDLACLEDYDKPVILTFDDGYDDNYTELYPLLQKYNVKATIFVIGNAPGWEHKMTAEQIKELSESGLVSIQSHSYTHDYLEYMDEETLEFEFSETNKVLTRITGKQPYVLCYPTGKYSDLSLEVAARYYNFGLKMVGGQYNTSDDPFLINRYYISRYTDIYTFAAYVSSAGA